MASKLGDASEQAFLAKRQTLLATAEGAPAPYSFEKNTPVASVAAPPPLPLSAFIRVYLCIFSFLGR